MRIFRLWAQAKRLQALLPATAVAAAAALCLLFAGPARAADPLSLEERATLQSAMAQYIDQHMIGDAFMHLDPRSGEVQKLYPVSQHPMIVRLNKVIVLCADLRTEDGKLVNADFYATKEAGQFVIFQTEIANREPLQALLMKGAASLLE